MANETTYALISSLLPDIWEAALMFAKEDFIMPGLVTVFMDETGMQDRKSSEYSQGTVSTSLGETTDLDSHRQELSRAALATLTPGETGTQYLLTDRRLASDDVMNLVADMAAVTSYATFKQVEADLVGNFNSFTGGTVGAAGSALTWSYVYQARSILAYKNILPPYNLVLSEYAWIDLATNANIVGIANAAPLRIRDEIQSRYYVASTGDIDIYVKGQDVFTAGTAVNQGMFGREALALDVRRGFRIEPERNASLRATEYNVSMIYAHGLWRPTYGVTVISDASAPS